MAFPERFANLPDYAFPRLRALLSPHAPGAAPIDMTIGEPRHPMPDFVARVLADNIAGFGRYPANDGTPGLRAAIAGWIARRHGVQIDPETQIMALNGTREGLFNAALALCPEGRNGQRPAILMPNPFYQVYAVAAAAVGAEPVFVPATAETGNLPDYAALPPALLDRTAIAYVCSPANPQGAVAQPGWWAGLMALAERHGFSVFSDECYSEIWRDSPPMGAFEAAQAAGADPERVLVFNSLSKRSNLPGLRSGFVAGGPGAIARIRQLRAYAGAPLPLPLQQVSEAAWSDEAHVRASRRLYAEKYDAADTILAGVPGYVPPPAGFFLWLPVPPALGNGEQAALRLWQQTGVRVLPGGYLARDVNGTNPGQAFVRAAMVAPLDQLREGLMRLRTCLYKT